MCRTNVIDTADGNCYLCCSFNVLGMAANKRWLAVIIGRHSDEVCVIAKYAVLLIF